MVMVKGPLLSLVASGKYNEHIEFRQKGNKCYVAKGKTIDKNKERSELQQSNMTLFQNAVSTWNSLTTEQKETWKTRAITLKRGTGYNLFTAEYILQACIPPEIPTLP